jgi:DNA-binding response OmpR family regulator
VRRRHDRIALSVPVELIAGGKKQRAISQDLSTYGMFIRLSPPLPVDTVVQLAIAPNGQRLVTTARVTHVLGEVEARTLGRSPGMGVMFRDPVQPQDEEFGEAVRQLIVKHAPAQIAAELRIVVADPQTRLLERLSTALGTAGFSVATATNGMEALGACLSRTPDVVLLERALPIVDGLHVLQELGRHAELANVPVMLMSSDATDLVRVQALQLGAVDFIPKPFTVLEVILRARRWARTNQRDPERVVLRGTLAELGLPSLLTMLEQERKTGQLAVTREQLVAWIEVVEGRIVRARSTEAGANSHQVIMSVLDWTDGYFELSSGTITPGTPEVERSITHLLLEHARLRDEAALDG